MSRRSGLALTSRMTNLSPVTGLVHPRGRRQALRCSLVLLRCDATSVQALDAMCVRPSRLREAGFTYVKIDQLRHYSTTTCTRSRVLRGAGVTRQKCSANTRAARQELGPDTFVLSCWVCCRIVVWPTPAGSAGRLWPSDHAAIQLLERHRLAKRPGSLRRVSKFKPAQAGTLPKRGRHRGACRHHYPSALASIAGCLLLLSDKPAVYRTMPISTGCAALRPCCSASGAAL